MSTINDHEAPGAIAASIAADVIRSGTARRLGRDVVLELLGSWSAKGGLRQAAARPLRWAAARLLAPSRDGGEGIGPKVGMLLTTWARRLNAEHASDPACHARGRSRSVEAFLKGTDFGEIREMLERSRECTVRTIDAFNEALWKYPAKVGSILGSLVSILNTLVRVLSALTKPIERRVGPDLLADLILSLLKNVDAKAASELANDVCEIIRRLHTGNLLLARAGRPLFQVYLTELLEVAFERLDPELVTKAATALAQDKEAFACAVADALTARPELALSRVAAYGSMKTPWVRALSRKARFYDELDKNDLADALARGLAELDTYEIAQAINTLARVVNDLHETRPDMFANVARSIADSLDTHEIGKSVRWIMSELTEAFGGVIGDVPGVPGAVPSRAAGGGA